MKYIADVTLTGTVEVEATSIEEAEEMLNDGWSITDFNCDDVEIDDVCEIEPITDKV